MARIAKKAAAALQIDVGVRLFLSGELVPSITLSGAAEDSLPDVDAPYLLPMLRSGWVERKGTESSPFNEIRNWLKHSKKEATIEICTDDAAIMLVRVISKYTAVFGEQAETNFCKKFYDWVRTHRPDWLTDKGKAQ
jgi:hypothetical protein